MKVFMLIIIFLLLGAFFIISNENLHLGDDEEFSEFSSAYKDWADGLTSNVKSLTGYLVKLEWLPPSDSDE